MRLILDLSISFLYDLILLLNYILETDIVFFCHTQLYPDLSVLTSSKRIHKSVCCMSAWVWKFYHSQPCREDCLISTMRIKHTFQHHEKWSITCNNTTATKRLFVKFIRIFFEEDRFLYPNDNKLWLLIVYLYMNNIQHVSGDIFCIFTYIQYITEKKAIAILVLFHCRAVLMITIKSKSPYWCTESMCSPTIQYKYCSNWENEKTNVNRDQSLTITKTRYLWRLR